MVAQLRSSFTCLFALAIFLLMLLSSPETARADTNDRLSILLLGSWTRETPWQAKFRSGFSEGLSESERGIELYIETLDINAVPLESHEDALTALLREKYSNLSLDAIVAESIPASLYLTRNPDLFTEAQRYYVHTDAPPENLPIDRVIHASVEYNRAIAEMIRLTDPKQIYLIGNSEDPIEKLRLIEAQTTLLEVAPDLKTETLGDLTFSELLTRVSDLPDNSTLFLLPIFNGENKGVPVSPRVAAGLIAKQANAPVFTAWETLIEGNGVVGGYALAAERLGRLAAEAVIKETTDLSTLSSSASGYYFDWNALKHWGLNTRNFFEGTRFFNQELSFFEQYRIQILSGSAVILAWLILTLVLFRARLKAGYTQDSFQEALAELRARDAAKRLAMEDANKRASRANRDKARFINNMVMELRAPVDAIAGYLQLTLQYPDLPYKAQDRIRKSQSAAHQLLLTLSKIQQFVSIDSERIKPELITFQLKEWINEVLDSIYAQYSERRPEIQLTWRVDDDALIKSDPEWIRICLDNLLSNALENTRSGPVTLTVSISANHYLIEVKDTGRGISEALLEQIFEPFAGLSHELPTQAGSCIGLPLVKLITEKLGGSIEIQSKKDVGTCVSLSFPVSSTHREKHSLFDGAQ